MSEQSESVSVPAAESSSFRDPSGYVFQRDGVLYRQVNPAGRDAYAQLMQGGLYDALTGGNLLIPHEEVATGKGTSQDAPPVLRPERIPFVSYPYEWCFRQLQEAALITLTIQREALRFGMSLKDASAYNIQFRHGSEAIHIDTLSFEPYREGSPWVAYRQFCQHFLAPLALIANAEVRLGHLLRIFLDGIPVEVAARLLPLRDRFSAALLPHIFLHSNAQQRHANDGALFQSGSSAPPLGTVSRVALLGLLDSLESGIRRLAWKPSGTEWGDYYEGGTNYVEAAFTEKKTRVAQLLREIAPAPILVLDLGSNTGVFSRIAAERGIYTVALDSDPAAVEKNFRACRSPGGTANLLPLVQDLTNPSPDLGWALSERRSLFDRCREAASHGVTAAFALALIHHLAIGNNVPLPRIAALFADLAAHWIVEWVPKEDSQVQRLLATRPDIFPDYTQAAFEGAFAAAFHIESRAAISGTQRTLYRLRRRE
ncbi:MAG: class I SAM-dependent methyltransferase [Cytophagales bacterium]|nr:class I SAM-dependent methyltransferase [Armatimonadota bacterium]